MIPTLDFGKGVLIQKSVPIRYYSLPQKCVLATSVHLAARERFEIHSASVLFIVCFLYSQTFLLGGSSLQIQQPEGRLNLWTCIQVVATTGDSGELLTLTYVGNNSTWRKTISYHIDYCISVHQLYTSNSSNQVFVYQLKPHNVATVTDYLWLI